MPKVRGSNLGSKKRYAGLLEKKGKEEIEIIGLEAIRGDWTEAAQEFQIQLLKKIFHKEDPTSFIKSFVKKIKSGAIDEKLIYRKSLRKPLKDYTKTTPPHVKAARKLQVLESKIIEYVITKKGPEPIQKIKHEIDHEHYIKKQIGPIANTILFFLDKDFEEIIQDSSQTKLF
jgi:DNA polymerase II